MPEIDDTEVLGDDADLHALRALVRRVEPIDPMWQTPPAGSWERIAEEAGLTAVPMESAATPAPDPEPVDGAPPAPIAGETSATTASRDDLRSPVPPPPGDGPGPGAPVSPMLVVAVVAVVLLLVVVFAMLG